MLGLFGPMSPFPSLEVPPYTRFSQCDWQLAPAPAPPVLRGYFAGLQPVLFQENWTLKQGGRVWMSITPMELESAGHHVQQAKGSVTILGFGMGLVAWNVALKQNVTEVHVVEKDPQIIELAMHLLTLPKWEKLKAKIVVHHADALTYRGHSTDFVLADIWPMLGDDDLRPDLQRIAKNIPARFYAAWGLEIDFVAWCAKQKTSADRIDGTHWIKYSQEIGVPLIMTDTATKARKIARASIEAARNTFLR